MAEVYATVIYLKKNFVIKKLVESIENKTNGTIILFGSFAKEIHTKESDVDIFIISDAKIKTNSIVESTDVIGDEISLKSSNKQQFLEGSEK